MSDNQDKDRTRTVTWDNPAPFLQAARGMSGIECLQAVKEGKFGLPPMASLLGLWISEVEEGRVVFAIEPAEYHYNPLGTVHGGVAATMLDSAMSCAVHSTLPIGSTYTTLDININFVRPLTSKTGVVSCEGKVIHLGGRIATAEGRLTDEAGKLYAHGTTTCILFRS